MFRGLQWGGAGIFLGIPAFCALFGGVEQGNPPSLPVVEFGAIRPNPLVIAVFGTVLAIEVRGASQARAMPRPGRTTGGWGRPPGLAAEAQAHPPRVPGTPAPKSEPEGEGVVVASEKAAAIEGAEREPRAWDLEPGPWQKYRRLYFCWCMFHLSVTCTKTSARASASAASARALPRSAAGASGPRRRGAEADGLGQGGLGYVLGSGHSATFLAKLRKYFGLSDQHLQITSLQDMRSREKPRFKSNPDLVGF